VSGFAEGYFIVFGGLALLGAVAAVYFYLQDRKEAQTQSGILKRKMNREYQNLVNDFIKRCRQNFGNHLKAAALYGSVARGSAQLTSDIDFILVFDILPKVRCKRMDMIFPLVWEAENSRAAQVLRNKGFYPSISPLLYTIEEIERTQPILLDITEDGVILFDNGVLTNKLQRLRERLKELGAKRVVHEDGSMYWDLKPDWRPGEEIEL